MERIDGALLMSHEYATRALVELMQIGKTASGANPILHDAPEAFNGIEMVSAPLQARDATETARASVVKYRHKLVRAVDTTAVGDHDHLFPRVVKEGHHLMDILAEPSVSKCGTIL